MRASIFYSPFQVKLELLQEGAKAAKVDDLAPLVAQASSPELLFFATPDHEVILADAREALEEAALSKGKDVRIVLHPGAVQSKRFSAPTIRHH